MSKVPLPIKTATHKFDDNSVYSVTVPFSELFQGLSALTVRYC